MATWASVPVGSVIVLYNGNDNCYGFTAQESGTGGRYFVNVNGTTLIERTGTGGTPSSSDCGYCWNSYTATSSSPSSWSTIAMGNSGDAIQVRCPDCPDNEAGFFHGLGYGSGFNGITAGTNDLGGAYVSGPGGGRTYELTGPGAPGNGTNWTRISAPNGGTPPATAGVVDASVVAWLEGASLACCGSFEAPVLAQKQGYRFGFQGQEKDNEVYGFEGTALSFEYRVHDARVGRFLSIDPLASKYPHNSPYAFSENRVVDSNELEGLESIPGGQIVTSDDLLAPALLTTATDATVTPLTLWDTQVQYPQGGPSSKPGIITEGVVYGAVFIHDKAISTVSNVLLTTSSLLSGIEIGIRYGAADIHQEFTDEKVYPSEPLIVPVSLNKSGTDIVTRKEIMNGTLTPSEGAEILGGAGSIVAPLVPAPTAVKMAVQGAVTGGLKALDDEP